ncbi:hypothetical protein Tco_1309063 [Tanacetum coccineum]
MCRTVRGVTHEGVSLSIPGNEKRYETVEVLNVFLDFDAKDVKGSGFRAELNFIHNAIFVNEIFYKTIHTEQKHGGTTPSSLSKLLYTSAGLKSNSDGNWTLASTALVKAYKDTSQFRAALVKKVNNWFQKEEEKEPKHIGETWYPLASSKPDRLKYLVPLFGVTKSGYISHEFIEDYTILHVKGYAVKEEKIIPVEAKVQLPSEFDFKPAEVYRSFDKEVKVFYIFITIILNHNIKA